MKPVRYAIGRRERYSRFIARILRAPALTPVRMTNSRSRFAFLSVPLGVSMRFFMMSLVARPWSNSRAHAIAAGAGPFDATIHWRNCPCGAVNAIRSASDPAPREQRTPRERVSCRCWRAALSKQRLRLSNRVDRPTARWIRLQANWKEFSANTMIDATQRRAGPSIRTAPRLLLCRSTRSL